MSFAQLPRQESPKHILFLSHYFPPDGNAPASRVHEMCRRWVAAGHEVTVVTSTPDPGAAPRPSRIDGIEVVRVWAPMARRTGFVGRVVSYCSYAITGTIAALRVRKPDVLIATSPQIFCALAGILVKVIRRVPFVLEVRDLWPASISAVGAIRSRAVLAPLEKLERMMDPSANHIVTVGSGYRQQLVSASAPAEKISIVANGIDTTVYQPQERDPGLLAKHRVEGKFVCAVVGTIGMASGLSVVLRAARALRDAGRDDIVFLLVGDGAVRKDLARQAKAEGLGNVVFTGRQPKQSMPAYLASVDACLVHLKRSTVFQHVLPSKFFEAAVMRRPVIMGVEGFAASLLEDAGAGLLIEPENHEQLVEAVIRLADDPELAREFGESGRRHVLQHYNRDDLAQDYLSILHDVWGGRRS